VLRDLSEVRDELSRWATSDIVRIPTGYSLFDDRTSGGMAPGQLAFGLARTGVGKTWLLVNIAVNNPKVPTVFFSLEMHGRYILERIASVHTNTPTRSIEATLRARGESFAIDQAVDALPLLKIEDEPDLGLEDMAVTLEDYAVKYGHEARLVLIDYLELIRAFGQSQMSVVQELARGLKNFAREHDVAVLCLHQVKRGDANNGHKPLDMTDGKFGSEESADYVIGMYKPSLNPSISQQMRESLDNDIRLQFLKTRTGGGIHPDGVQHHWNADTGRISEVRWEGDF
jgi:replicative DNA helicase